MSDPMPFGAIFPGRKLETSDWPANLLGTNRVLQPADEDRLRLARRNLREIPEEELERLGPRHFRDEDGTEFEIPHGFVDLADPRPTGAEAFCVRDGYIVPLRPRGERAPERSVIVGEYDPAGWRARKGDRSV
jgi:hypothetical protein